MPDLEALLVTLVLAPATFSRNRFFDWYKDPEVRRVRGRAAELRTIVRHVTGARVRVAGARFAPQDQGRVELAYELPSLGLRRRVLLDPLEHALVRYSISKSRGALSEDDPDRALVQGILARLAPVTVEA